MHRWQIQSVEAIATLMLWSTLTLQLAQCTPPPPTDRITKDGEVIAVGKNSRFHFLPNFSVALGENSIVVNGDIVVQCEGQYGVTDELHLSRSKREIPATNKYIDVRLQWVISNKENLRPTEWREIQIKKPWAKYPRQTPTYRSRHMSNTLDVFVNGKLCLRGTAHPRYQELDQGGNWILLSAHETFRQALCSIEELGLAVQSDTTFLIDELRELDGHLVLEGEVFVSSECGMALIPCLHLKPLQEVSSNSEPRFAFTDIGIDNIVLLSKQQNLLPRFYKKYFDFETVTWEELYLLGAVENKGAGSH